MKELNRKKFSVDLVCEYYSDFSNDEIADLKEKMKNGKIFNPEEKTIYLQNIDMNNLYGSGMSEPLPDGGFEWEKTDLPVEELPPSFVRVDLSYPPELHDYLSDFVPAPNKIIPEGSKFPKLAPNLLPKKNYDCYYKSLKYFKELGLNIEKIHGVLKFKEEAWLKPYIDVNTNLRTKATNNADKDMYKLLNNAMFGKTCENLLNRTDYRLACSLKEVKKYIGKPTFKDFTIYNDKLVGIHLDPAVITLNKPSCVGIAVLEHAKLKVYKFFYDYLKPKYGNRVKLLMTDTDSFFLKIETEDWYEDIKNDIPEFFDTSDFPDDHPAKLPKMNKIVIGMMKDELNGEIATEFCGTCAKSYAFAIQKDDYTEEKKKCKGIKKNVVKNEIDIEDYKNCVLKRSGKTVKQTQFRSYNHDIYTEEITKVALSPHDDKGVILPNGIRTLPIGHWRTKHPALYDLDVNVKKLFEKGSLMNLAYNAINVKN